ncbi:MAG: two-component sensor histidine kinase [Butyrivibrio sp.]|uniref:sensor histidine kinase n=1 Tax=Butyrivibrio sp. TaxID=28121 RepID=UPI001B6C7B19|nr:ATP-binding protein [Butyrivibrio sp.]MBP3274808.1 two-component sensor histidine kinase [Butyrivibrio sp.]MBP3784782.1 two-component sensor histidine kinase [Butyrivibrio sp.]MBP3814513.1 two-component sensor histidine kinase [Butyrivibrio sp.]
MDKTSGFKIRGIYKSLRVRFFVIVFLTGLISCLVMHSVILDSYENRAVNVKSTEAQTQLRILANHLIVSNYLQDTSSEVINAELDMLANLYDGRVIVINDDLKVVKDTYNISQGKTIISEEVVNCLKTGSKGTVSKYDQANGYIEIVTPIIESEDIEEEDVSVSGKVSEVVRGVLLTSVSTETIAVTLKILSRRAQTLEIMIILIILLFAAWVSIMLLRPFDRITTAINDVKAGYTDEPIVGPNYLETEQIINAFNALLRRMKVLDDSRQEFVSNVSHELKTPITSMKVLADSLLAQEDVPNEVYREFMTDIGAEIDREDKIINDLLALVKMDKKASGLTITSVDVVNLTEIVLKRLRPIARKHNIELTLESKRAITAEIDEVKISLVIMNLVENAIKYNKDEGWVKVELDADHQFFYVKVIDSGYGIPEESLDHIYERFYRVDKSRSREIGGTGLGLSIARNAVLMHRGTIDVSSVVDEGTTFTVKIPLTSTLALTK